MANSSQFDRRRELLRQTIDRLPAELGALAVGFFKARFRAGGWHGSSFEPWKARSPKAKRNAGRALMVLSGRLRRSIRVSKLGPGSVTIGSDVPYAKAHNEGETIHHHARSETFVRNRYTRGAKGKMFGGKGAFKKGTTAGQGQSYKAYDVKMPKRQYMGESQYLNRIIGRHITNQLRKAFNQ